MGLQIAYSEDCKLYTNIEFLLVDLLKQVKSTCSNAFVFLSYLLILILRWVSKKWDVGSWTELIWLSRERSNEPSGSTKYGEFLD
jgi:hypothetical protein